MLTTRNQKSTVRKSTEADMLSDMLSDIENMDILLGSNHFEREDSEVSSSVRRPKHPCYNALTNHEVPLD